MKQFAVLFVVALVAGCQTVQDGWSNPTSSGDQATAVLQPTKGHNVKGSVSFVQGADRVRVSGAVSGLQPNSQVGFHIHEAGDCSSGDGMSAKGHFNPRNKPHGHPTGAERHAGDLPMLRADASGNAGISADVDLITVAPGPNSIVGRGLIVHVQADDYKTQPTGNAGARAACAIIQRG